MNSNRELHPAHAALAVVAVVGFVFLGATARGPIWREIAGACFRAAFWTGVIAISARIGAALTGSRLAGPSHLIWDGAAGLPVLIASWLVVGLVPGGFAPLPILVVLAAAAIVAVAIAWRERLSRLNDTSADPSGTAGVLAVVFVAVAAMLGLAWDRVPPLFFDSLAYHWAQPELWIVEG